VGIVLGTVRDREVLSLGLYEIRGFSPQAVRELGT